MEIRAGTPEVIFYGFDCKKNALFWGDNLPVLKTLSEKSYLRGFEKGILEDDFSMPTMTTTEPILVLCESEKITEKIKKSKSSRSKKNK